MGLPLIPDPDAPQQQKEEGTGGESKVEEVTEEQAQKIEQEEEKKKKVQSIVDKYSGNQTEEEKKADEEQNLKDGKMKPDPGNGGHTETYHWEQNLMEITVYYYLPDGTAAKDLKVDFGVHNCKI